MSIPISKYVAITTAIANAQSAPRKELILRLLTTNPLFAANTVYEFFDAQAVADFAGALSIEAQIASTYFGWISKTATQAGKISFMRYSFDALAPYLYSTKGITPLAILQAVTDGSMVVNLGSTAYTITNINLSSAQTYADVATALQTAIQANADGGELWTTATVTYNPTNTSFQLTGGTAGSNEISYATSAEEGTDISSLIGWDVTAAPILSNGTTAQNITNILNKTINLSTNFLTFGFINPTDAISNLDLIGSWVDNQNNKYRFGFDLGAANYAENIAIASKYTGMTAHYNINYGIENQVPAWVMSAILPATTNYNKLNGVKNYMFQEFPTFPISVGIDDENLYQTLDNLNINYNGQTQKAGKTISFYQNGINADGTDTAVFDNEAWLKDAIETDILNAFLALDFIPADTEGIATISGILAADCQEALDNHVFSKGKTLTQVQKAYITQLTGNENTWLDVQNNGYYFTVDIITQIQGNATIYIAEYTLIYLKNDTIRKVNGRNILI